MRIFTNLFQVYVPKRAPRATDSNMPLISFPSSGDLSGSQYCFVKLDSNGRVVVAGDGEQVVGVLHDQPKAIDRAAGVFSSKGFKTTIRTGGVFNKGDYLVCDGSGRAVANASTSDFILGVAEEASTGVDHYITMVLQ